MARLENSASAAHQVGVGLLGQRGAARSDSVAHQWIDSSGNDRPFRRFRRCENCGVEQEHTTNYLWMRVVSYQWWPLVGRCKGKKADKQVKDRQ
jgi:hypothetical protein